MENYQIDFVLAWVDGSDPAWQKEKMKYCGELARSETDDEREIRFTDIGLTKYWFRTVEKYAPWVGSIFFVTWGHIPAWLNTEHPKLKIVKHEDFIPQEYLPTFSSHTIELNFHRIKGLSEHFVYFNDDMFLTNNVVKEDFFKKGRPRDVAAISAKWYVYGKTPAFAQIQDTAVINKYFSKNEVIRKNFFKWINPIYGNVMLRTISLLPWPKFIMLYTQHLPTSNLKSTFRDLWDLEPELFASTCSHKIRSYMDINQWIIQFWQICCGNFYPAPLRRGRGFVIGESRKQNEKAMEAIRKHKYKMVCIGEGDETENIEDTYLYFQDCFEECFGEKSSFEV